MPSPESVQIRSNLLAFKAAQGQGAPVPLLEQRASFDVLVGTVESRTTREAADPINSGRVVNALSSFYAGTEDAHQPLISPINADLHGFQLFASILPEGQQSLEQMGRFIRLQTKLS